MLVSLSYVWVPSLAITVMGLEFITIYSLVFSSYDSILSISVICTFQESRLLFLKHSPSILNIYIWVYYIYEAVSLTVFWIGSWKIPLRTSPGVPLYLKIITFFSSHVTSQGICDLCKCIWGILGSLTTLITLFLVHLFHPFCIWSVFKTRLNLLVYITYIHVPICLRGLVRY